MYMVEIRGDNVSLNKLKGGLIVSCQALPNEPLHSSFIMSKMAKAACLGGAVGIRANSTEDITAIKKEVKIPIIGLDKQVYKDSIVFITPTIKEVDGLVECGADIIATDATNRIRPDGKNLQQFFIEVKQKYPNKIFMADCSTYEEGIYAASIGFDIVGTTLSGYTEETKNVNLPNIELMKSLVSNLDIPVIAEGGIWSPEQCREAMETGVFAVVVGTAITRVMEITKRYVNAIY